MRANSFTDCTLWKRISTQKTGNDSDIASTIRPMLELAERILIDGSEASKDYTLHDHDHAFRVAERMAEVVGEKLLRRLSGIEIGLLILSAYLHDIGMAPPRDTVKRHFDYLLFPANPSTETVLNPDEQHKLMRYLDDSKWNVSIPLAADARPSQEQLRTAWEIVVEYTRYMHNDWSEQWIRQELSRLQGIRGYPHWMDDVIQICKSHHYGMNFLESESLDPIWIANSTVHRRFVAMVLRIADILENDPERTPVSLVGHRQVSNSSRIYWQTDHYVAIKRDGDHLVAEAEPPNAHIENAVRSMIEGIAAELSLCAHLVCQRPLHVATFAASKPLPHSWDYPAVIISKIRPRGNYVYINGAFRPNTLRVLELLSGVELYRDPLVAVRELLQNAFDAVREAIGIEWLKRTAIGIAPNPESISSSYYVKLSLEVAGDNSVWLTCKDNGVGMSKAIIESYFLVSGSSRRHDAEELSRRCRAAGYRVGRTGRFGVGALSYFMIADRLILSTLRRDHPIESYRENNGWRFETNGLGSFGELTRLAANEVTDGTEVRLRVKADLIDRYGSTHDFEVALRSFVNDTVVRTPCQFDYSPREPFTGAAIKVSGWSNWSNARSETVLDQFVSVISRTISENNAQYSLDDSLAGKSLRNDANLVANDVKELIRPSIRWRVREHIDSEHRWAIKVHIPSFTTSHGESEVLLLSEIAHRVPLALKLPADCYVPGRGSRFSWRGMSVSLPERPLRGKEHWFVFHNTQRLRHGVKGAFIEVDFLDDQIAQISVSRLELAIRDPIDDLIKQIKNLIQEAMSEFRDSNAHLCLIASAIKRDNAQLVGSEVKWLAASIADRPGELSPFHFPAALPGDTIGVGASSLAFLGKRLNLPDSIRVLEPSNTSIAKEDISGVGLGRRYCLVCGRRGPLGFIEVYDPSFASDIEAPRVSSMFLQVETRAGDTAAYLPIQAIKFVQRIVRAYEAELPSKINDSTWPLEESISRLLACTTSWTAENWAKVLEKESEADALQQLLRKVGCDELHPLTVLRPSRAKSYSGQRQWELLRLGPQGVGVSIEDGKAMIDQILSDKEFIVEVGE